MPQPTTSHPVYLIDAIGPFFHAASGHRINWSKIPFHQLPLAGADPAERDAFFAKVTAEFTTFCRRVAADGYNAVTLDDVTHLAECPHYEPEAAETVHLCREIFRPLFDIAVRHGLAVYLTMDVLTFTPSLREKVGTSPREITRFLPDHLDTFLGDFPEVDGVILRIGESDGQDVRGLFRSELVLHRPADVNALLKAVLPVFERRGRTLVFRTWTVGAGRVGDLIWHRDTFRETLEDISSRSLVVSMKYGESDFFRFLPLNRNFFQTSHKKIVELQARREYEGAGEFPAPVTVDYERYARELDGAPNMVGASVWCQTGGWLPFKRRAYLEPEGVWNEINAVLTIRIFRFNDSVEQAVAHIAKSRRIDDTLALLELLRLAEESVKSLLYIEEFARQKLFFRRVRIPPLLAVYWNNIFVYHSVKKVLRHFVSQPGTAVRQGRAALANFGTMVGLAQVCRLPVADIIYMRDTFSLLALARDYYFRPFSPDIAAQLGASKLIYKQTYPRGTRPRYRVEIDLKPFRLSRRAIAFAFALFTRRRRAYRRIDRILSLGLLSWTYRLVRRTRPALVPEFARKSAMGIDSVFR